MPQGFLNGEGATPNVGLLDQRFALEWVQKHIHLFGGDRSRVTVMGESAGGGSVQAQLAAYGGAKGLVPFRQAISQSPFLMALIYQPRATLESVLRAANNSRSVDALRELSSTDLQKANFLVVGNQSYYGTGAFCKSPK